ncbi:MAG TPA: AarF/UbiB family protein [Gemmatimonadales bacterium]|nr:AarF/UbiB family protein [Gemmatimonadales bacterium]
MATAQTAEAPRRRTARGRRPERAPALPAPPGLVRRAFTVNRHLLGLCAGGLVAHARPRRHGRRRRFASWAAALVRPFVRKDLVHEPFPVQLRRRLELLGPTYIKLGQILSLREDLLPRTVTDELHNLLDRLPDVPFAHVRAIVEADLDRPLEDAFLRVDPEPIGSASIAQIHRATTLEGDPVVLKVVKPGIREILARDARLLKILGRVLELVMPQYQPRRILAEFVEYTARETDLRREADSALTFAANFADEPDIVFPAVYPELCGSRVLCMEYLDGLRPDTPAARALPLDDRKRLVDLGAEGIIRMIYQDGFFHADLHPANLLALPGPKVGFIDLGMVGRLDDELRRTLVYYYYSLVNGDAENAARYLTAVAEPGRRADLAGFRREVADVSRQWRRAATFEGFSLGRLILESLRRGARFDLYFPIELVLMVKALITFEGVGHTILPGVDIAAVSRRHIRMVFLRQFSPWRVVQDELRSTPDLVDALVKLPLLVTQSLRALEKSTRGAPPENPLAGMRGSLLAGFSLVAGAILLAYRMPWPLYGSLFALAAILAFRPGNRRGRNDS